jgi:hypothetical protein
VRAVGYRKAGLGATLEAAAGRLPFESSLTPHLPEKWVYQQYYVARCVGAGPPHSSKGSDARSSDQSMTSKNIPRLSISDSSSPACRFQSGVFLTRNLVSWPLALRSLSAAGPPRIPSYCNTVVRECRVIHRAPSGRSRRCCGFSGGFLLRTQHGPHPEQVEQIMGFFG